MRNVGARMNERVVWMAPPYGSPEQLSFYENSVERMHEPARWDRVTRADVAQMRAGGLARGKFDRNRRLNRSASRAFRRAMRKRTAACAASGPFWCIWGFKP